jgi:uncharacterized Zn finger protein
MEQFNVHIQESCDKCDSENVNIWGTIKNRKFRLECRCMNCGARLHNSKNDFDSRSYMERDRRRTDNNKIMFRHFFR